MFSFALTSVRSFPYVTWVLGHHHDEPVMCSIEAHNIDRISLWGRIPLRRSELELIHDQLPLAVPCYDLLPVTELTVDPREVGLRALPAPLS